MFCEEDNITSLVMHPSLASYFCNFESQMTLCHSVLQLGQVITLFPVVVLISFLQDGVCLHISLLWDLFRILTKEA